MDKSDRLARLVTYIEENLRASKTAGIEFVDPRRFRERLASRQNHVVFGRRGAGKSTLLSSIAGADDVIVIALNIEDYKDITFPNIILQVLAASFEELASNVRKLYPFYRPNLSAWKLVRILKREAQKLVDLTSEPDQYEKAIRERTTSELSGGLRAGAGITSAGYDARKGEETEISATKAVDKLNELRNALPLYKNYIQMVSKVCQGKSVFLALDDFYFVPKSIQPDLIDYFHRLTKGTDLFLKLATIKHRSFLYKRTGQSYVGVEIGHDIHEVDLDYTLDNFQDLKRFMDRLLTSAIQASGDDLAVEGLFAGVGFDQLCLASGGVPRDFLSLFVRLANDVTLAGRGGIGKVEVTEAAIGNIRSKLEALRLDSAGEDELLEEYLYKIKSEVYTKKRTNVFLVAKPDLEQHSHSRQAIRELVDLRLIHIVDKNTSSAPSDGRRYEAYLLDMGLYDNSRPRNFSQVEPGTTDSKSRKDAIRAAPRIVLPEIEEFLTQQGHQPDLFVTDQA